MKWQGKNISYEIKGESHAEEVSITVWGLKELQYNCKEFMDFLARRKPKKSAYSTSRQEDDERNWKIVSEGGKTVLTLKNTDVKSGDYDELYAKPRPSHADYASYCYDGRLDFRGGREFSARLTAPYCLLGSLLKQTLAKYGVEINAYVQSVGGVEGISYKDNDIDTVLDRVKNGPILTEEMEQKVLHARSEGDSVGGCVECIVTGMPEGMGYTWAEGIESAISIHLFSIPAVKGVEFGAGFSLAQLYGSQANDETYYDGGVKFYSNNAGGINGGISNGMPITMRVAFRPTPSISKEQRTVDLVNECSTTIKIKGRHDACIVPRALPVVESAVAIALYDLLLDNFFGRK